MKFDFDESAWIHVSPLGEFPHAEAGVVQVIDADAVGAIAADFAERASAENFPGLLLDFDHFSMDTDKSSEAAGWITALRADGEGLWAKARWTDAGKAAVEGGRFRLVSPVFPAPGRCEDLGGGRIRPRALVSVALTNDPNIKGGHPLTNRAPASDPTLNRWGPAAWTASAAIRAAQAAARKGGTTIPGTGVAIQQPPAPTLPPVSGWSKGVGSDRTTLQDIQHQFLKELNSRPPVRLAHDPNAPTKDYQPPGRRDNEKASLSNLTPEEQRELTKRIQAFLASKENPGGWKITTRTVRNRTTALSLSIFLAVRRLKNAARRDRRESLANRDSGSDKLYRWDLGDTKTGTHCPVCTERAGQVKTIAEWKVLGKPPCKCKCRLTPQ